MTLTTQGTNPGTNQGTTQPELLTLTIDGVETSVPKGTLLIRAAEQLGVAVPRFCDHPLLDPVAACRACLVEIEGQGKPQPACAITASAGMVVRTQVTSEIADKAQHGVMEFLLVNHPLDCPVCDKGGECPLQNQAMSNGRAESRFDGAKRTFPKPINISTNVLLDRERCVLCARCTRFSNQIAGDPFIELLERGALQQVGIYENQPFESYFSGNTVQICPVGALTSASYRFRARPFDLMSTPSTCEHCAAGCAQRTDHRRGKITRRLAGNDPQVNEEWNCDKGRWAFQYERAVDRLTHPLVRDADSGELVPASWPEALSIAARGLADARGRAGVLVGGRLPIEDAYAYAKFARVVLGTNDVDFRARPHTAEEAEFLAAHVAGTGLGVTYAELEAAPAVVLVGLEPEDEAPIVFLRLRKAVRHHGQKVLAVAPFLSRGLEKLDARLVSTRPGHEVSVLERLGSDEGGELLLPPGAVVLVGERLADVPGGLSAAARLADARDARLAWVPRRAGDRGAVDAGALPNLLPGGRPVSDAAARVDVQTVWGVDGLPSEPGRDSDGIVAAAVAGDLAALVVAGVDPLDLPDPAAALAALDAVPFLVSLEIRSSAVTQRADVVLPVASVSQKSSGTFLDWEGRERPFGQVLDSNLMTDARALTALADELDVALGLATPEAARAELLELGGWEGARVASPTHGASAPPDAGDGEAVLTTWHHLLDEGRLQDDEHFLAGTARAAVVRMSAPTAESIGAGDGDHVTVANNRGSVTLPLLVTDMADGVVWLPTNSPGSAVRRDLAATSGATVQISRGSRGTQGDAHGNDWGDG